MNQRLDPETRARLLQDDAQFLGQPIALVGDAAQVIRANTRHITLMMRDGVAPDRASAAAAFVESQLDGTARQITAPLACGKGCSHCCTTYVSCTIPEVFRLAQAIRGNQTIKAAVLMAAARSKAMPQMQREFDRVVCPILVDHACSAYAHRPVVCRSVLSTSLDRCLAIFQQNRNEPFAYPDGAEVARVYSVLILRAALILCGLPHQNIEVTHALEIALADEHAEARWLAGEPLFAGVAIDRGDQTTSDFSRLAEGLAAAIKPTL